MKALYKFLGFQATPTIFCWCYGNNSSTNAAKRLKRLFSHDKCGYDNLAANFIIDNPDAEIVIDENTPKSFDRIYTIESHSFNKPNYSDHPLWCSCFKCSVRERPILTILDVVFDNAGRLKYKFNELPTDLVFFINKYEDE